MGGKVLEFQDTPAGPKAKQACVGDQGTVKTVEEGSRQEAHAEKNEKTIF